MNIEVMEKEIKEMSKGDFGKLQAMVYAREEAQRENELAGMRKKLHIGSIIGYMGKEGKRYHKVLSISAAHVSFEVRNGDKAHRRTLAYDKILEVLDKMPEGAVEPDNQPQGAQNP